MKTIEFALNLTPAQRSDVSEWMDTLKRVYNRCIAFCEWRQHWLRLEIVRNFEPGYNVPTRLVSRKVPKIKIEKTEHGRAHLISEEEIKNESPWAMSCPIAFERRIDKTKSWDSKNIELVYFKDLDRTGTLFEKHQGQPYEPVKDHWLEEPPINGYSAIDMRKPFAVSRWGRENTGTIYSTYITDYIGVVPVPAWERYLDPSRTDMRRPRYKGRRDKVDTIVCESMRKQAKIDYDKDKVKLPGLGWVDVPALDARLGSVVRRQREDMLKNPGKYKKIQQKADERRAFELVLALINRYDEPSLDPLDSHTAAQKQAFKTARKHFVNHGKEKAVKVLQKAIDDRSLEASVDNLSAPGAFRICRKGDKFVLQIIVRSLVNQGNPRSKPIGVDSGLSFLCHTSDGSGRRGMLIKHRHSPRLLQRINALKKRQSKMQIGSNNWKKIGVKISNLQRREAARRRSWQHYISTWLVDTNKYLFLKKINLKATTGTPLPRPNKEGTEYLPNGRQEKREKNATIAEASIGQFYALVEEKVRDRPGREITYVECEAEASANEVLAIGQSLAVHSQRTAQNPDPSGTREGVGKSHAKKGESQALGSGDSLAVSHPEGKPKKSEILAVNRSVANAPKKYKGKKRSRTREKVIG